MYWGIHIQLQLQHSNYIKENKAKYLEIPPPTHLKKFKLSIGSETLPLWEIVIIFIKYQVTFNAIHYDLTC